MFFQSEYIISKPGYEEALDTLPSFLMLGRSNVGKSSFINTILNRKNLARTSSTPGKTIALNYYLVDQAFYFIDAPGYGYARRAKSTQDYFYEMLNDIVLKSERLVSVILLIDFKVGPTQDDLDVFMQLKKHQKPLVIIATKVDQIPKTKRFKHQKAIETQLGHSILTISSTTKEGIESVKMSLERLLMDHV
jgi:GTP-binding protein